ncbi:MAG: 50S ribosomal protein L32 [Bacteroidales bacterium]|jgi:large subunit ribosomal protein L32|nr:50S ribosomal protein L32 [Bacteroidales bacterium]MBQ8959546.1 50S ribosomal protein L32 [Bacteroidales bacterium]MBR1514238.1 50S ribosomal protein L32 [Bacteroidales bacterium]MCR5039983.1 50S ribosomal protein L32 [Bacteroidales bacterium]
MAHPKRRQSHTRGAKRRTHYKAETPNVTIDPVTGTMHVMHRAYYVDGDLYYRGQLVMAAKQ